MKRHCLTKEWIKRYVPIISSLGLLFILSIIFIFTLPGKTFTNNEQQQKEEQKEWPLHIVAPFIDLSSWVSPSSQYSLGGVPNVGLIEEQTGLKYYNLGFIQPDTTKPVEADGTIRWGWGGLYSLSEKGNDGYQYPNIKKAIKNLSQMGAKYTISVGGQLGDAPWIVSGSEEKLAEMYLDIIDTYSLKRLDLDIEESNQVQSANITNAKAIKRVQDQTGIEVVLTIPIMPSGWQDKQINIIRAYLEEGVNIAIINSMTMCYGTGVYQNEDYGDASVRAIENSIKQMKEIYKDYGVMLSDKQAYEKTGATVDIGYESNLYPVFTTEMTAKVVAHAKQHGYGMLSYWSLNRDSKMDSNKGVTNQFEFLAEMNKFY